MKHDPAKYLLDVQSAISRIEFYISSTPTIQDYANDIRTQDAVERQLAIIGEAINKALKENPTLVVTDAKKIVAFRNLLVHSYDTVFFPYVWDVVQNYLPLLKKEVAQLLKTYYRDS